MAPVASHFGQRLHLKRWRRSRYAFLFAACVSGMVWLLRPATLIDTIWSDVFLANQRHPACEKIVIVSATLRDLRANGTDRLSRSYFAALLARLDAVGVSRLVIDFNLGADLLPEEKRDLQEVLGRLGPKRVAIGYEPDPLNQIDESLARQMTVVDLRLIADSDGRFRQLCNPRRPAISNAALWLATGETRAETSAFDLRVLPTMFRRFSFGDLFDPNFETASLRDALVVISLEKTLAKSRANLPIYGAVDRGVLVAMATQAQLTGYANHARWATLVSVLSSIIGLAFGYQVGLRAASITQALIQFALLCVGAIGAAFFVVLVWGLRFEPAAVLLISLAGLQTALACRLGLVDLVTGMFAGNLSPEEVWAWRAKGDAPEPVVLFDALGGVKRLNDAARQMLELDTAVPSSNSMVLARLCMPGVGQRASQIRCGDQDQRVWDLEWPYDALPLVVLHDVTSTVIQEQTLRQKLITDPLTGVLNRTGFEAHLASIERAGRRDYAILFLDMNGFKAVNDTHGHEAGDALLKATAARFAAVLRGPDTLARLGGDEFAVIAEGELNEDVLLLLRGRLEASLNTPIRLATAEVTVGVAIGFGMPTSVDDSSADVLHRADLAMYARKAELKLMPRLADTYSQTAC